MSLDPLGHPEQPGTVAEEKPRSVHPCPAGDDSGPRALQAVTLGAELRERGVGLHVIEQGTDTVEGRAMSGMLSVLAELRNVLIVASTMDGLATARARGPIAGQSGTAKLMPPNAR